MSKDQQNDKEKKNPVNKAIYWIYDFVKPEMKRREKVYGWLFVIAMSMSGILLLLDQLGVNLDPFFDAILDFPAKITGH